MSIVIFVWWRCRERRRGGLNHLSRMHGTAAWQHVDSGTTGGGVASLKFGTMIIITVKASK